MPARRADEKNSHAENLSGCLDSRDVGARVLRNRSGRATFLCYHSVALQGPRYLTISPRLFERQLANLRRMDIRCGGLADLAELSTGRGGMERTVFLTFDDGFRDNYETVLPLLRERGARAFVFVLPPLVDTGGVLEWPEVADDARRYKQSMRSVTWPMLEEMKEGGFEVGSHTLTHPHLPELDDDVLREELWESRRRIKERLGSCDVLAYPFGEWSSGVEAAARDCGYSFAFSLPTRTGQRLATPLAIPRINVDYRDAERRFGVKLSPIGKRALLSPFVRSTVRILRRR